MGGGLTHEDRQYSVVHHGSVEAFSGEHEWREGPEDEGDKQGRKNGFADPLIQLPKLLRIAKTSEFSRKTSSPAHTPTCDLEIRSREHVKHFELFQSQFSGKSHTIDSLKTSKDQQARGIPREKVLMEGCVSCSGIS